MQNTCGTTSSNDDKKFLITETPDLQGLAYADSEEL